MKAFVIGKDGKKFIRDVEKPTLKGPKDVLVKVKAAGICGTDLHIYQGEHPMAVGQDRIPGHEFAGEVVDVGPEVRNLKPGDRVVHEPIAYCGECYACTHGQPNVCRNLKVTGCNVDGGWQEFFCAPERQWHKIPDWVTWTEAACVEPYTIGAQVCAQADVQAGDVVLIHGDGPIGLICGDTAKHLGATVIISGHRAGRLQLAKDIGLDYAVNSRETNLKDLINDLTDGEGVNVILDCVGLGKIMDDNLDMLSPAGRFVPVAVAPFTINNPTNILAKQLKIVGSRLQNKKFAPVIARYSLYKESIDRLVTDTYAFEDSDEAFQYNLARHPETGKVVILFGGKE